MASWMAGTFRGAGEMTYSWTATARGRGWYYYRHLSAAHDGIHRHYDRGAYAMSVRCVKDCTAPIVDTWLAEIQIDLNAARCKLEHPSWSRDAVMYEANVRQFTRQGTFKAFTDHLPRLKRLGVDIIWLMPIHPISKERRKGVLGAHYAVSDHRKVHPMHGTLDDFKALVRVAHDLDMHILMDWVARYTGYDHPWITEHPDWYQRNSQGKIIPPNPSWWDCAALDYRHADMRRVMIEMMTSIASSASA